MSTNIHINEASNKVHIQGEQKDKINNIINSFHNGMTLEEMSQKITNGIKQIKVEPTWIDYGNTVNSVIIDQFDKFTKKNQLAYSFDFVTLKKLDDSIRYSGSLKLVSYSHSRELYELFYCLEEDDHCYSSKQKVKIDLICQFINLYHDDAEGFIDFEEMITSNITGFNEYDLIKRRDILKERATRTLDDYLDCVKYCRIKNIQ